MIGDANRLAHAAALAVAEMPGLGLQPAVHLRAARARQDPPAALDRQLRQRARRGLTVRYTTAEAFTNRVRRRAAHRRRSTRFKAAYRGVDVLLVDDVQFLQSKARTEEEFFHTFNALHERRRAARADLRPPAARPRRARGPPARALRGRPGRPTSGRPTSPRAARSCASACSTTASTASTPAAIDLIAERVAAQHPRARGRADPRRRLRLAHRPRRSRRPRRRGPRRPLSRAPAPARAARSQDIQERICEAFGISMRGAALHQPRRAGRLAAPGRHVPRARAHRPDAAGDRPRASAAATTRRSCTPAGGPPSASPPTARPTTPCVG